MNLQHLRRFAKPASLARRLRQGLESGPLQGPFLVTDGRSEKSLQQSCPNEAGGTVVSDTSILYLLVCSASAVSLEKVVDLLTSNTTLLANSIKPQVYALSVPAQAPTSDEQAKQWSQDYWPTVYKKHNPNGPAPSVLSRAEDALRPCVGMWIAMARAVASDSARLSIGERIGAVVVDPTMAGGPTAVAAAGDARWRGVVELDSQGRGNVMAHAVMRVIGMVARKRREALHSHLEATPEADMFLDYPITPWESTIYPRESVEPGGYLCMGLEIVLTHEPCVMCSMAILHSRFDQVVFAKRMPLTGALSAETPGLAYGLPWLPELNWKLLAWQFVDETDYGGALSVSTIHS